MVGSVLLVEDVRFTRAMTRRILLTAIDGEVHEAASGQEALEALRLADDIEAVVSDISLPGVSGLELLKAVRTGQTAAARDLPFIITSGAVTEAVRQTLQELDVTAVIAKPVRKGELVAHLGRIEDAASRHGRPLRDAAAYRDVDVTGHLEAHAVATSPVYGRFDDFDDRVRFLETVPALEGMDLEALHRLAERAEIQQFSENSDVEPAVLASHRLLLIAWGEAEVLRTARSTSSGGMELRVDLLEAGDLLGITAFMSLPGDAEHSQIRFTRPTEVLAFDFTGADTSAGLAELRDKVKLSVGRTLAHRLTQSDEAKAEVLAQRLAETRIKRTAGGFVIMQAGALAIYTLTVGLLLDLELEGPDRAVASAVMILVAFLPFLISVWNGPFRFTDLGLTLKGARAATIEAVLFTSIFIAGLVALKYLIVTFVPAYQGNAVFELTPSLVRPDGAGGVDLQFYALNVAVYVLFAPFQEVVVRCGLQSLIREFLYGSERYRAVVAILVSNILFAAAHTHLNVGIALSTFLAGMFFGWLFHRRRSIVGVSLAHIMLGGTGLFALSLETFLR